MLQQVCQHRLWEDNCLKRVTGCIGMSLEGLEIEFLNIMKRVSKRRNKKGVEVSTRFDIELKKLEWIVSEKPNLISS